MITSKLKVEQVEAAIPGSNGILTTIARRLQCDRHTAKKFINNHPTLKAMYEDEVERVCDAAESVVFGALGSDDTTLAVSTAKWLLTKKRANIYGDKLTIAKIAKEDIEKMTDEQLEKIIAGVPIEEIINA